MSEESNNSTGNNLSEDNLSGVTSSQVTSSQVTSSQDTSSQATSSQDTSSQDTSSQDNTSRQWEALSYQQFQFLTANASDVIWSTDLDLNLTYISESVRRVRGYSPEEAMALGLEGALTIKSMEDVRALVSNGLAIDASADPARSTRLETRISHKDGHEVDVEVNVSFLRDNDNKPIGLFGISRDISDRKQLAAAMQAVIRGTDRTVGSNFFESLVKNIASVLGVRGVVIGELKGKTVETVAVCLDGEVAKNFSYQLAGSPCEQVMDQSTCSYPMNVQALFPEDQMLVDMNIESYLGTPLLTADGNVIGVLSCIDIHPMVDSQLGRTSSPSSVRSRVRNWTEFKLKKSGSRSALSCFRPRS